MSCDLRGFSGSPFYQSWRRYSHAIRQVASWIIKRICNCSWISTVGGQLVLIGLTKSNSCVVRDRTWNRCVINGESTYWEITAWIGGIVCHHDCTVIIGAVTECTEGDCVITWRRRCSGTGATSTISDGSCFRGTEGIIGCCIVSRGSDRCDFGKYRRCSVWTWTGYRIIFFSTWDDCETNKVN